MYALCDQRSFYASCEAVFRPDIRGQAIYILSNNDGCVVALNDQAKAAGVKKFEPYFKQRLLIQRAGVHAFSSNYALYGNISDRIMQTLRARTPSVEIYSIDEGFCDLSGIPTEDLKPLGRSLRQTVWNEQRIPCGVSIAPTKTIAKLGQFATKKIPKIDGVAVLTHPHQWEWLARRVPVAEVWGVGRRLSATLTSMGVVSAHDLALLDKSLARKIGGLPLARTIRELNGEPCIPMELNPPSKQQIICSRSFGTKLYQLEDVLESVSAFAARAAEKLRSQDSFAGRVSVWLMAGQHQRAGFSEANSVNLPGGSDDSRRIAREAVAIAKRLYRPGGRYIKAGVELVDIRPRQFWQMDLLNREGETNKSPMPVVDQINRKYGRSTVMLARQTGSAKFSMKQQKLSPLYLTRWQDIPKLTC
tara:strand:+ start:82218 stop:83471 length:1254 start_codon:yes stop_codon:yes gene_type:complete